MNWHLKLEMGHNYVCTVCYWTGEDLRNMSLLREVNSSEIPFAIAPLCSWRLACVRQEINPTRDSVIIADVTVYTWPQYVCL